MAAPLAPKAGWLLRLSSWQGSSSSSIIIETENTLLSTMPTYPVRLHRKARRPIAFGLYFMLAPQVGLEPTTYRLTAGCSTIELLGNIDPAATYSPRGKSPSTIGAEGLNFRVRDGNGWDPFAIATG